MHMKKILFTLSLVAALGTGVTGCSDYLDSDYIFDERMSLEDVFNNRDYTDRWLARAYYFVGNNYMQDVCSKKNLPFNFADDMYYGDGGYDNWRSGNYSESSSTSEWAWEAPYRGIRQTSIFIQNIDKNTLFTEAERADLKGQAYFLRGFFYWELVKVFGPVPIVPDEGIDYTKEYDEIAYPRNTYDECIEYIVSQMETAAGLLPLTRGVQELARPTRGAALAIRARALLYAASPLFNGQAPAEVQAGMIDRHGNPLLSSTYDDTKWARAAAAARDVMELQGKNNGHRYMLNIANIRTSTEDNLAYPSTLDPQPDPISHFDEKDWPDGYRNIDPFESYRSMFNGQVNATENTELIFTRGQNQGGEGINVMVLHQLPRNEGGGYNCHGITQKQCDAYYMADGSDCDGMNSMYIGREGYTDPMRYNDRVRSKEFVTQAELDEGKYPELGKLGVGVCKQYVGREPRFYASVAYNGSTWYFDNAEEDEGEVKNVQVWYYRGDPNGYKNNTYWLKTGIGIKKYVHPDDISNTENVAYDQSRLSNKVTPDIRFAEILLIYAEAINEVQGSYTMPSWDGSTSYTITRDVNELKKGIQPIRIRAGIPDYEADIYADVNKFRIKLKRERQIELFAEGHRYFDVRRWCDAPAEESTPVYGCNAYCSADTPELFQEVVEVPDFVSVFSTKMWFYPIHHDELRRNKELSQNPGWKDAE